MFMQSDCSVRRDKHRAAIKNLRLRIKTLAEEKPKLRAAVHALKFDLEGKRRPETGGARYDLKRAYNEGTRPEIRAALLAYGILRGVPYKVMESSTGTSPDKYGYRWLFRSVVSVVYELHQAMEDDAELKAEWTAQRVEALIKTGIDPVVQEAA